MPASNEDIKTDYPLPVYNYRVEVGADAIAFSEVSGLGLSFETTTYKESPTESGSPGPRVMRMPGQLSEVNLTLKKGVVRGKSVAALYNWINSIQTNQIQKQDISIRLCDEAGAAVISWTVLNAFPTKLDAPSFDANSNDVAVESLELMADRVTMEEA